MDLEGLVERAWNDPAFKRRLLAEPKQTIQEMLEIQLPDDVEIFIHEQTPAQLHLLLPMKPDAETDSAR